MKNRVSNRQSVNMLPMTRQPAILPRVGGLIDYIGSLLASRPLNHIQYLVHKLAKIMPQTLLWAWTKAKLASLWYQMTPPNLLWPTLVPIKIKATLYKQSNDMWIWVDKEHEAVLWQNGSFGKGILSRADATWLGRYKQAIEATEQYFIEDLTMERRENRRDACRIGRLDSIGEVEVSGMEEAVQMEPVQLWPLDALFLSELGCLDCVDADGYLLSHAQLWRVVAESTLYRSAQDLAIKYAAYFSFRARGWTVKSGIKFGSDFLLYGKGGPARSHSKYSVIVKQDTNMPDESWQYMFALSRVCSQVRKPLVVCYVELPHANLDLQNPPDLTQFLIQEFLIERFNPNRK